MHLLLCVPKLRMLVISWAMKCELLCLDVLFHNPCFTFAHVLIFIGFFLCYSYISFYIIGCFRTFGFFYVVEPIGLSGRPIWICISSLYEFKCKRLPKKVSCWDIKMKLLWSAWFASMECIFQLGFITLMNIICF
jgi:hypothetical protein